jgi:hypothetical protein
MHYHLILFLYSILFIHSIIGYGIIFSKMTNKEILSKNIGYIGIVGFFFISLISIFTSFFFAHDYLHNIILHSIGILGFLTSIKNLRKFFEIKYLWLLIVILWLGIYVYKNHDDFPYYHLTYALNLSENSFMVGTGNFSHGFRTFSSLFFFHSILYMPFIDFYLFHSGPFFILIFFNFIIISNLLKKFKNNKIDFIYFFSLLSFIFINVAFYRVAEHGTDRSAQILLILIFIFFFEIIHYKKSKSRISTDLSILLILVFLASSMKAIYYLYLILIPIIFFKKNFLRDFLNKKNFLMISFISLSFFLNLTVNYLNTGCLLYPAEKTCIIDQEWSIKKDEVKRMSIHYEWWAKAGGGPGYVSEIKPEVYVKKFNWVHNWIKRHFFNKVSDTLLGIIFISLLVLFIFKYFSKMKYKKTLKLDLLSYFIPIFFLLEWFFNHPSMRYGGYVLFAIPIFLVTSVIVQSYKIEKKKLWNLSVFFIVLVFVIFNARNFSRIVKEAEIYDYNVLNNPYFYVQEVESVKINKNIQYNIYSTKNNQMCWASKTPCSYRKNLEVKKFLWMNMVYKNVK